MGCCKVQVVGGTDMEAIKIKARVGPGAKLELLEPHYPLPEGNVEVILLYARKPAQPEKQISAMLWPVLNGGRYLGGALRRVEIYSDDGR